jgi:ribosomal-protein-alanine N-acetyltransferase
MHALDLQCFAEAFRFDLRSMRRFAFGRRSIVRVAEGDGGELAGFIILELTGRVAYVVTLDVADAYRRQGMARRLLTAAIETAAKSGAREIALHVHAGNKGALAFHEAAGFEFSERAEGFYGPGLDGWVYRLRIDGRVAEG